MNLGFLDWNNILHKARLWHSANTLWVPPLKSTTWCENWLKRRKNIVSTLWTVDSGQAVLHSAQQNANVELFVQALTLQIEILTSGYKCSLQRPQCLGCGFWSLHIGVGLTRQLALSRNDFNLNSWAMISAIFNAFLIVPTVNVETSYAVLYICTHWLSLQTDLDFSLPLAL